MTDVQSEARTGHDLAGQPRIRHSGRRQRRRVIGRARPIVVIAALAPVMALIIGVVLYPAIATVTTAFGRYSITGLKIGSAGWSNFTNLFVRPELWHVVGNTLEWVFFSVGLTILFSLALAQFLAKPFVGRKVVRWMVLLPWAAALVMTSQLFDLLFDYYHGLINQVLLSMGLVSEPVDWLGNPNLMLPSMIAVGVFVSIPFTTYLFIAGLATIPHDLMEAAGIDGASPWQRYFSITLPLLKPSISIAVVLNTIYVFNSFPINWILNAKNPGFGGDILTTYMYKIAFKSAEHDVGLSAAVGVLNVVLTALAVAVYMMIARRKA